MNPSISHDRADETIEGKVRWFRSLSLAERMELFCESTELILSINPGLMRQRKAIAIAERVRVLELSHRDADP